MSKDDVVINHYQKTSLLEEILAACGTSTPTLDQLSAFDEFHVGRGEATSYLGILMELTAGMNVLDVVLAALRGIWRHVTVLMSVVLI